MREIARAALLELHLDYAITLVSGGASRNYEIVMWDKLRDSYFTIRLNWNDRLSRANVADKIKKQLSARLAAFRSGGTIRGLDERRPRRYPSRPEVSGAA